MRSWLTYIFLLMVACGTVLTSCSDVLSEEGLGTCDDRTTVRLTISFGGDDDPMSRDVGSDSAPEDDDLDYTTEPQAKIVDGDIFALVVTEDNKLVEYIDDLHIDESIHGNEGNQSPIVENYIYTWTLKGTMKPTSGSNKVKIVLLANLKENGIDDPDAYFKRLQVGTNLEEVVYKSLIYSYNGNTWSLSDNRIPMWGETAATTVPASSNANLPCYLYRAMAKVQIWVDNRKGIDGFKIDYMEVMNVPSKGYCVSNQDPDTNSPHYNFGTNNDPKPYVAPNPYSPTDDEINDGYFKAVRYTPTNTKITYNINGIETKYNDATQSYSDMIYLPEHSNTDDRAIIIKVYYTFNGQEYHGDVGSKNPAGIIQFRKDGIGSRFDVIRNHSYIFNITAVKTEIEVSLGLSYQVVPWSFGETDTDVNIDVPSFN